MFSPLPGHSTKHGFPELNIWALVCNETIQSINTAVTLFGDDLRIDLSRPPVPDEVTTRISALNKSNFSTFATRVDNYHRLGNYSTSYFTTTALDHFFSLLTTSRYAVAPADFARLARGEHVADAIHFQNNLVRAQELGQAWHTDQDSKQGSVERERMNMKATYAATVKPQGGVRRMVQSPAVTRAGGAS